jgi:hypothetical protein
VERSDAGDVAACSFPEKYLSEGKNESCSFLQFLYEVSHWFQNLCGYSLPHHSLIPVNYPISFHTA